MRPAPGIRVPIGAAHRALPLILAALGLILSGPAAANAQQNDPGPGAAGQSEAEPQTGSAPAADDPLTFLDSVTVSATLRPAPVRETPGMVSVIDSQTIEERLVRDFADLVKYEPGVYIENNVTRLGLNGFNIRGIGGNRVMTQVDGVQTSEQFDFGPFNVHQVGLDVDALKTVEIVRSANSALYGSDALGGVVSLFTKDPADYLDGQGIHLGAKTTWDGRSDAVSGNLALAAGTEKLQGSVFASVHRGNEIRNKGTVETADDTRTAPNPQDIAGTQLLAKLVFTPAPGNMLRTTAEVYDTRVETEWFSDRGLLDFGRFQYVTADSDALDTQDRSRVSVDHTLVDRGLDQLSWRLYGQFNDTSQIIDRERMTFGFGPPFPSLRHGTLDFEQVGYGTSMQGQQWIGDPERGVLLTAGANYKSDYFDILRDRSETHGITGEPVPTSLIFPTKYFPESTVTEAGAYLQAELQLGRLSFVPGVRYDHFALDANQNDPVFIASLNPEAADFSDGAVSPKLGVAATLSDTLTVHAQYSGGFRAPPYSAINTGFTNPRGGYTTLPNPELRAETSRNVEVGVRAAFDRASLGLTVFSNRYDDFIASTSLGLNPVTQLLEFQSQNLDEAEIEGVELRGEAYLSDSVMLRWSYARINGVEIFEDTVVPPLAEETQLGEIAPNEGVLGLRYVRPSGRWGSELSVRMVEGYQHGGEEQFAPDAYQVVDLVGFASLAESRRASGGPDRDPDFDWTTPLEAAASIAVTTALDSHALVAEILLSRALDVSEQPEQEVVVVVAHGPTSEEDNALWLANMGILVETVRSRTRFSRIQYLTVRDDASDPVREQATVELRAVVEDAVEEGRSVLIVPLLLSYGGIEAGIRRRLEGLTYRMAGQALLPDERLSEWVLMQATQ